MDPFVKYCQDMLTGDVNPDLMRLKADVKAYKETLMSGYHALPTKNSSQAGEFRTEMDVF